MKLKLLVAFIITYQCLCAQNNSSNNSPNAGLELQSIKQLEKRIQNQERQLRFFDQKLLMLKEQNSTENASLKSELKGNLELQAQNERAVNLALDEFSAKFEAQNKTMDGVQTTLNKQWRQQLILFGLLFIVLLIGVAVAVRISTKKALEKSRLSWEEFNAYVLSERYKRNG
jgi:flagellar biosynthesis/type III secretory pathway M-ring protein FliF/YscJ